MKASASSIFVRPRLVLLLASLCCLLWGSAYPAVKTGFVLLSIDRSDLAAQLLFAGYRFVAAGFLLLVYAALSGKDVLQTGRQNLATLLGLGVFQTTLQYLFFYAGLANTTGVKASILNAVGVFFSVLIAHWVHHDDSINMRKVVGCLLGFAGVVAANRNSALGQGGWDFTLNGEGFVVMAALILSAAGIYGKRVSQRMDTVVMTGYQLGLGGGVLLTLGAIGGGVLPVFGPAAWALLTYLALLSATAFALWGVLLKYNRVSTVSIYSFLVPVFGAALSALFLGESLLEWKYLLALLLVSAGIWLVTQEKLSSEP